MSNLAPPPLSPGECADLRAKAFRDPIWFLNEFLPDWFPTEVPWVHVGIAAIVLRRTDFIPSRHWDKIISNFLYEETPGAPSTKMLPLFWREVDAVTGAVTLCLTVTPYVMIMMPRGYSKTTLINGLVIFATLHGELEFGCYLGETGLHANNQLGNIKRELESNPRINAVYGCLASGRQDPGKWTEDQIETTTGRYFVARGRHGQVRGLNINAKRPDWILGDDIEDKESVATPEQRKKARDWVYEDVMPAIAALNPNSRIIFFGTLLHKEAVLRTLSLDPQFTSIVFGAEDRQGELLWPLMMDKAKLAVKKASFIKVGNLAGYYREYYNLLRDDDSAKFKQKYIHHVWVPDEQIFRRAMAIDPAISPAKRSDFCAFAVVGMSAGGRIAVLHSSGERGLTPRQQVDRYFELHFEFGLTAADYHSIEANAYQMALVHLVTEEMFRKRTYFEVTPVTRGRQEGDKITRVEGILQPRYAAGYVLHRVPFPHLEQQLLDWPNDKLDLPDCLAQAIALLDPTAPMASVEDAAGLSLDADEFPALESCLTNSWGAP